MNKETKLKKFEKKSMRKCFNNLKANGLYKHKKSQKGEKKADIFD